MKVSKKKRLTRNKGHRLIKGGGNNVLNKSLQRPLTPLEKFQESCNIEYDSHSHSHRHNKVKVPFYCYGKKIYELTNQSIGIQYNENRYDYYTITPLTLSVPTIQLATETGSLSIVEENDNYYLGFTNNFPSLIVQQTYNYAYTTRPLETNDTYENSDETDESKPKTKWFNVYEDKDTFTYKDKKFEIIEDYIASENYVIYNPDTTKFNKNRPNLIVNESLKPHYLKGGSLSRLRLSQHRKSSKKKNSQSSKKKSLNTLVRKIFGNEKTIYISTDSNLKTFEYLTEEVRKIIEDIKKENNSIEIDKLLFKRKLAISRVIYRTYINFNSQIGNIIENIRWVVENALWLEKYLELRKKCTKNDLNEYKEVKHLLLNTAKDYKELQHPMYESDFSGLDSKYIIVDDTTHPGYVICGYPEKQMKAQILNFWQDIENTGNTGNNTNFAKQFKKLDTDNSSYIAKLFNKFKEEKDKIKFKDVKDGKNKEDKDKIKETEYYKLYMNLRKSIFKYIENRYIELNKEDKTKVSDEELQYFKDNFEKNATHYFQKIALKYLPKPMVFIKYVFLVFKRDENNKLYPCVFNVKELIPKDKPIIKHIERLIKHELPYRFDILSKYEYINRKGNKFDLFDDEYKLFYSRYRYGKFFHISTEYVHTMSNISDKAHDYKNSITLEELIYVCGLNNNNGKSFLEDFKIEYEVREHQINNNSINYKNKYNNKKSDYNTNTNSNTNDNCLTISNYNRSDVVFCLYKKKKEEGKLKELQKLFLKDTKQITTNNTTTNKEFLKWKKQKDEFVNQAKKQKIQSGLSLLKDIFKAKNNNKIKFILMFKTHQHNYTFIYNYENIFYKLVIESNITQILVYIIKELNTKIVSNNINDMVIKFTDLNKCFRVVSNNVLDIHDYKFILFNNPLVYIDIKNNYLIDEKIDLSIYYKNGMLISQIEFTIKNLYKIYPLIYLNYKNSKYYTDGYKKFKYINTNTNTIKQLEYTKVQYEDELNECSTQICLPDNNELNLSINYIFYNSNNCKYDFVEIINNGKDKILLYVFPSIMLSENEQQKYYIRSFLDLNEHSLPMLKEIKKIYLNKNYLCFLHISIKVIYNVLHFHLIKKNNYLLNYPEIEKGGFIIQNIQLDTLISNIETNKNYYNNLEFNLIY